jgi:uncharacterized protein YbjT (DUF2867 family)
MRIAVVGATGAIGAEIVRLLAAGGHDVRALSRHTPEHPVDLVTGEGLAPALAECETVVDASNATSRYRDVLVTGTRNLLTAERRAGVRHHVHISIVGCDRVPGAYYEAKTEQDAVVRAGGVEYTVVRATQFHPFLAGLIAKAASMGVVPVSSVLFQPVDLSEAARAVADVAVDEPRDGELTVGGPEIRELTDLAKAWKTATGSRALPVPIPLKGAAPMKAGALTVADPDVRGTITFDHWLAAQR